MASVPILANKDPNLPSAFAPAALLREARRQKGLRVADVPPICILDPDGDIVRRLRNDGQAKRFEALLILETITRAMRSWDAAIK